MYFSTQLCTIWTKCVRVNVSNLNSDWKWTTHLWSCINWPPRYQLAYTENKEAAIGPEIEHVFYKIIQPLFLFLGRYWKICFLTLKLKPSSSKPSSYDWCCHILTHFPHFPLCWIKSRGFSHFYTKNCLNPQELCFQS